MLTLGVVVYSLRGMSHLARCLDSVRWADAVVVCPLDQEGENRLPGKPGTTVKQARTELVLHLWGDECVEIELARSLQRLRQERVRATPKDYQVPVRSYLLGSWVEGSVWGPTPSLRLFPEARGFPPHWWELPRKRQPRRENTLPGWISDYSFSELAVGLDRLNIVSSLWAQHMSDEDRTGEQPSVAGYPMRVLMRQLFSKRLLVQGTAGLTLSALSAYATLVGGMKWHELRRSQTEKREGSTATERR